MKEIPVNTVERVQAKAVKSSKWDKDKVGGLFVLLTLLFIYGSVCQMETGTISSGLLPLGVAATIGGVGVYVYRRLSK